jgi:[protein-PII] uridylyltransferase
VWNGWKGQLLRTLFYEAEPLVSGGHATIPSEKRVEQARERFAEAIGWPAEKLERHYQRFYHAYWLGTDLEHQLRHARLIDRAEQEGEKIAIDGTSDAFTAITEITVYTLDHPHLLALLAGACAASEANITGAKVFTTADGWALDTLFVQRKFEDDADEERRIARIAENIRKALTGELRLDKALKTRRAPPEQARAQAFDVAPQVVIDNSSSNRFTIIEVAGKDRIGLLYELTSALYELNLNIASAHITTYGERAVDVFYVTDLTGGKITSEERQKTIREKLMQVLSGEARATAAA